LIAHEFVAASSESLDRLESELVVLPFFSDERPLRGAAGLADWRLCGALSRKMMAGYVKGRFGEKALIVAPTKLRIEALMLFGLGPAGAFDANVAREACRLMAEAIREARVSSVALALPGRSLQLLPSLQAMQLWLETEVHADGLDEISIIEAPEEHRGLTSVVDGLRRQAESPLG
jgi:hypothetical protein